jgi:hypothetical protein
MTLDEWVVKFKPIENPGGCGFEIDDKNFMFETFGVNLKYVKATHAQNPLRVWTLVETDDEIVLVDGLRIVNRIGYFVTEVPSDGSPVDVVFLANT